MLWRFCLQVNLWLFFIENYTLDVRGALANGIYSEGVNIFTLKNPL